MRVRTMSPFPQASPSVNALPASAPPSVPPSGGGNLPMRLFSGMAQDDYILLGIIALLFFEGCEDYILMAALGYLYIMGIM